MIEIQVSDKIWDLAADYVRQSPYRDEMKNIGKQRFWTEGRTPNMQGVIGELGFVEW